MLGRLWVELREKYSREVGLTPWKGFEDQEGHQAQSASLSQGIRPMQRLQYPRRAPGVHIASTVGLCPMNSGVHTVGFEPEGRRDSGGGYNLVGNE